MFAIRHDNGTFLGTGAAVGKMIILTVAHNLSISGVSSEPREIGFFPGKHGAGITCANNYLLLYSEGVSGK
jgi:hypothetical protein